MKLVVADDSALLREGLVGLLERQKHTVLAQVGSAPELVAAVDRAIVDGEEPDVVLTDVRMPPGMADDGLKAALELRHKHPAVGILVLSQYVAPAYASDLFASGGQGGVGYLLKDRISRVADFMRSLSLVASGGVVIDPEVATRLMQSRHGALESLTPRELEVLSLMAAGLSNQQISDRLVLSGGAVSKHVANVFTKLGLGPDEENRRVRAVLAYLTEQQG